MARSLDSLLPAQRKRELLNIVTESGHITVPKLAGIFSVSADTIRRDLDQLAGEGRLTRTRGGALAGDEDDDEDEVPFTLRTDQHASAKKRIATATAALIHDGESVILNGGTTTLAVARALAVRNGISIVTSNLLIPPVLDSRRVDEVYVVGGSVRLDSAVTVGPLEFPASDTRQARQIKADVAVIGIGGITADNGYSATNLSDVQMMRSMMESASMSIIVCDSSKFGRVAFTQIAPLEAADYLVTDEAPPAELASALEAADVRVIVETAAR